MEVPFFYQSNSDLYDFEKSEEKIKPHPNVQCCVFIIIKIISTCFGNNCILCIQLITKYTIIYNCIL